MFIERFRTSFIIPKLIFYTTIALGALTVALAYAYIAIDPHVILNESMKISDSITTTVTHGTP